MRYMISPLRATVISIFCIMLFTCFSQAATIKVPADYAKIQDAVLAAQDGDTVEIGPGTYTFSDPYVSNYAEAVIDSQNCTTPENIIGVTGYCASIQGTGGYVIVRMEKEITDGPGDDFYVYWWTSNNISVSQYARYYVSANENGPWVETTSPSQAYNSYHFGDLAGTGLSSARYVKIESHLPDAWMPEGWTLNVYRVDADVDWERPIVIESEVAIKGSGIGQTIIDASNLIVAPSMEFVNVLKNPRYRFSYGHNVFEVISDKVSISDLTIKNSEDCSGIYATAASSELSNFLEIRNIEIANMEQGIYINSELAGVTIENCNIHDNLHGGIETHAANSNINGNILARNTDGGGQLGNGVMIRSGGSGRITNNICYGNSFGIVALQLRKANPVEIINNTAVENLYAGVLVWLSQGDIKVAGNILANNVNGIEKSGDCILPVIENNLLYGNSADYRDLPAGTGDIYLEPEFVDAEGGNYHLKTTSPGINLIDGNQGFTYFNLTGEISDPCEDDCKGKVEGMATKMPDSGPNSPFYGVYQVTETVGTCDPVTKIVEVGNDATKLYNQNYIYIPASGNSFYHQWNELNLDSREMTLVIDGQTIEVTDTGTWASNSYQGWEDEYTVTFAGDYNSFTFSGTLSEDGDEPCQGEKSGTGVRLSDTGSNTRFYGTYKITETEGACDEETKFFVIGNDPAKIGTNNYLYLPASGTSFTFSGEDMDGDFCQWSTSISGDSITLNNEGYAIDNPDNTWSEQITANFAADLNSFTYSGTSQDDDADECQGNITGSGTRVSETGSNTKFYGTYIVDETLGSCTENNKVVEIGNDALRIGDAQYIYLPADSSDMAFSYQFGGGDYADRVISVVTDTLTIDTVGYWHDDPSKGWTEHIYAVFSSDMTGVTYTGTLADDDPEECQGALAGTGTRLKTTADNSRFFGTWRLSVIEGTCSSSVKILTIGKDASKKNVDNYIYLPQLANPISYQGVFFTDKDKYDRTITTLADTIELHDNIDIGGCTKSESYKVVFTNYITQHDIDGEDRIQGGMIDVGADETNVSGSGLDLDWQLELIQHKDQEGVITYTVKASSETAGLTLTTPLGEELGIPFTFEGSSLPENFIDGPYSVEGLGVTETSLLAGPFPGQFPVVTTRVSGDKSLYVEWAPWTQDKGNDAQVGVILKVAGEEIYSDSFSARFDACLVPYQEIATGLSSCSEFELIVVFTNICDEGISKSVSRSFDVGCTLIPLGDYNADELLTLEDCLIGLGILTGKTHAVSFDYDPTGNTKVEPEDVVYILKSLAESD